MNTYLSTHFLNKIEEALNQYGFLNNDFIMETTKNEEFVTLKITYLYISNFYFLGTIYNGGNQFQAQIAPGGVMREEEYNSMKQSQFFTLIRDWLSNIKNELSAGPIARKMEEHDEILKGFHQKIYDMDKEMDGFFSKTEGEELKKRLDEFENIYVSRLEEIENASNTEIRKLKSEIESLRQQVDGLSKRNWFLSFSTRLYMWYQRNPIAARQLAGASRQFLPEEAQTLVSDEVLDQLMLPQETNSN